MPVATPEVLARGEKLFHDPGTKCNSCHGDTGKGDGSSAADLKDDWGRPIVPRDLTLGIYRNGSRPLDVYRTIACGVKATPMPAFGNTLSSDDIWALSWYVKSLGAAKSPVW
jgi:mono/diheme cytochrome c family protein